MATINRQSYSSEEDEYLLEVCAPDRRDINDPTFEDKIINKIDKFIKNIYEKYGADGHNVLSIKLEEICWDHTPLTYFASRGFIKITEKLLELGAKINNYDGSQGTPLYYTIESDNFETVKFLLENGADPNMNVLETNMNITQWANSNGYTARYVSILLQYGGKL
jgi:ankyrin repeat protein